MRSFCLSSLSRTNGVCCIYVVCFFFSTPSSTGGVRDLCTHRRRAPGAAAAFFFILVFGQKHVFMVFCWHQYQHIRNSGLNTTLAQQWESFVPVASLCFAPGAGFLSARNAGVQASIGGANGSVGCANPTKWGESQAFRVPADPAGLLLSLGVPLAGEHRAIDPRGAGPRSARSGTSVRGARLRRQSASARLVGVEGLDTWGMRFAEEGPKYHEVSDMHGSWGP